MPGEFCKNHDVVWYMMESQSRVVAKSGIPSDRFHLGKLVLQGLRDAPDYVMQIDAVSGEEITFGEILERSVRCASAFQNIGLRQGDVVLLIASNNLNISVPYYAALYMISAQYIRPKPTFSLFSPPMLAMITGEEKCDATCFEQLFVGGSAVHKDLIIKFKSKSPKTHVLSAFGATELGVPYSTELPDSLGQPLGFVRTRLVDPETQEDVNEPHRRGELWTKGHSMFLGYYNNPTETKNAFSEDGWFKTGDLFYKDEYGNIHFVERLKLLLKYKSYQISPVEIESVILQNPGVNDVCVVGIPDLEHGELAVAFVVKKDGATVTAQDIKNVVQQNLAETKHLHGGVIFIDKLPLTVSTKVHRQKLKEMAKTMVRE